MTTFTAISATETQSGKPLTESLLTRLANNLLAVIEGDPTAPDFLAAALEQNSGTLAAATSRSGGSLTSVSANYAEYLNMTFDNDFPNSIECALNYSLDHAGFTTSFDKDIVHYRIRLNGSIVYSSPTYSPTYPQSLSGAINLTIPTGSNTIILETRTGRTSGSTSGGSGTFSFDLEGSWL